MHSSRNGGDYGVASPAGNHGRYSGPADFGGSGFSSGGGNGYGFGPVGGCNTSSAPTAARTGVDANTLAALAALLAGSAAQPPAPSASLPPFTASGMTCNAPALGVVGPPPGLAPIGTTAGLSQAQLAAAQQLPSRPAPPHSCLPLAPATGHTPVLRYQFCAMPPRYLHSPPLPFPIYATCLPATSPLNPRSAGHVQPMLLPTLQEPVYFWQFDCLVFSNASASTCHTWLAQLVVSIATIVL